MLLGLVACGKAPIVPVKPDPEPSHPSEPIQPGDPNGPKSPLTYLKGLTFVLDTSKPNKPLVRHWCKQGKKNATLHMTTGDPKNPIKSVAKGKISKKGELKIPLRVPKVATFDDMMLKPPLPADILPKGMTSQHIALNCKQDIKVSAPKLKFAIGMVTTDDGNPLIPFQTEDEMYETVHQPSGINLISYADRATTLRGTSECSLSVAGITAKVRGVYHVDLVKGWNVWRAEMKYVDNYTREFHFKNANEPTTWLKADLAKYIK